jgi:tRNA (guanine37-N1)-methyltransferase
MQSPVIRFHVLTIFPGMFESPLSESIVGRARERSLVEVRLHDIRDHATDRHRSVDDYSFGGGPGMVMTPAPLFDAVEAVRQSESLDETAPTILLSPQGRTLTQPVVEELARHRDLVLVCGRYEGFDERVRQHLATDEISVGDYVLSGGELAAMIVIDAVTRLVPGAVGSSESTRDESFTTGLLEYPQYTRPAEFRGWSVPEVLLSGDHKAIERWRRRESLRRTFGRRPDLLDPATLSDEDRRFLDSLRDR